MKKMNQTVTFKYLPIMIAVFSAILLSSNIAAVKLVSILGITLTGGFFIFPFSYTANCILVEVYGYKNARLAIWCGFILCFTFMIFMNIVAVLPPSPSWNLDKEFKEIILPESRIMIASLISYLISDFIFSYVFAKSKQTGNLLFFRIMKSSIISIIIGVFIFIGISFYQLIPNKLLLQIMLFASIKKILCQIILFPLTYLLINKLKDIEPASVDDFGIDFTPFSLDNVYEIYPIKTGRKLTNEMC